MRQLKFLLTLLALGSFLAPFAHAAGNSFGIPSINISMPKSGSNPGETVTALRILILFTVLSLAPAILIMMTSFTRIVVVLSFLRQALATQNMPPNQLIIGLSLFLTFFVMSPVWQNINTNALGPYMAEKISQDEAIARAEAPLRVFMFKQTREKDLMLFTELARITKPQTRKDVPTWVLIPAFMVSELKTAFQIGFMLYLPFLIIDMVVASVLMAMGMMMLPPVVISLPFKLLLFVLVDGWELVIGSLVRSFG
ncbi:MAG TPA: flagellar type III secretion system pore protein FliP [Bdellovibrionota bacterium]|jgi:flagellar biosynthetic protein FliP